jgi:biopolymer transport protein ExbD
MRRRFLAATACLILALATACRRAESSDITADDARARIETPVVADTKPPPPQPKGTLVVRIDDKGTLSVDGASLSDADLRSLAEQEAEASKDAQAVIYADGKVGYARVVEILDLLRAAGVVRIAFGLGDAGSK